MRLACVPRCGQPHHPRRVAWASFGAERADEVAIEGIRALG
jgi:hypothetical protein